MVCLIVTGLATFMNAETRASEESETPFSLVGVAFISLALVIDAALINIQVPVVIRFVAYYIIMSYLSCDTWIFAGRFATTTCFRMCSYS